MNSLSLPKTVFLLGPALLLALFAGCYRNDNPAAPVVAAPAATPAPAAAAPAAVAAPVNDEYYVDAAPPPPQTEVRVASPGVGFVWIGGYWGARDHRHEWVAGHWERPPQEHRQWVEPRWEHRGRGYVFVRGYWH